MASNNDESIRLALLDKQAGVFNSYLQAAAFHGVPVSTLQHRSYGRPSRGDFVLKTRRLTVEQERCLAQWVRDMQYQAMPPAHSKIRAMAEILKAENGPSQPLGLKWVTKFLKRNPGLTTGRGRSRDLDRLTALTPALIDTLFDVYEAL